MLLTFGLESIISDVYKVSAVDNENLKPSSINQLKKLFFSFLEKNQSKNIANYTSDPFDLTQEVENILIKAFSSSSLNDMKQNEVIGDIFLPDEKKRKVLLVQDALNHAKHISSDFNIAFELVIHSIVLRQPNIIEGIKKSHGGSSSVAIGSIWFGMDDRLKQRDLVEMLVHELAHHLLFIRELNTKLFDYSRISNKENYAVSAILKTPRPLDKVLHSIVVASEILLWRESYSYNFDSCLVHPASSDIINDTLLSIKSIKQKDIRKKMLSTHAYEILEKCEDICNQFTS